MSAKSHPSCQRVALMLPGGGARGAYQVGALKAITEINESLWPDGETPQAKNPFPIIVGTSAGAVNAAILASHCHCLAGGVEHLTKLWGRIRCHLVYHTDLRCAVSTSLRWLGSMLFGFFGINSPPSLLGNTPLRRLLDRELKQASTRLFPPVFCRL